MAYEIDLLPVGDGSKSGDAIALRYGNLDSPAEQTVIVIDGGYTDDGEALVDLIKTHYNTEYVDVVVSTHPDQDHVTGLEVVLQELSVGELWMHQPWLHSEKLRLSRRLAFAGVMDEKVKLSLSEASDLEKIAQERGVPIKEPFTGLSTPDQAFFVIGPDQQYYDELVAQLSQASQRSALEVLLSKAADLASKLVPESLHIETLTDSGSTSPQNNSSVISVLNFDGRISLFTGDAGQDALSRAMDEFESLGFQPGLCRFVQVPHHGSRRNVGPTILTRILGSKGTTEQRGRAFVSAAAGGAPKHPAKAVTNAFRRRGYPVNATQGTAIRHNHEAPARAGYVAAEPLPLYPMVEASE